MTDSKKPPNKCWFKNTPENVAEFMRRYPDVRSFQQKTMKEYVEYIEKHNGAVGALSYDDGFGFVHVQNTPWYAANGYKELDLTPEKAGVPTKVYFKSTPENVAEFMRRYLDLKNENGNTVADLVKILNGSPFAFYIDETGRLGWCQTEGYCTAFKFAELDLTPAPKLFPFKHWFANTKENREAAAKQFPDDKRLLKLIAEFPNAACYGFMFSGAIGYSDTKDLYFNHGLTEFKFDTKPEAKVDLVELAKKCEGTYWKSDARRQLSTAVAEAGYPHLAKAVLGGTRWSKDIAEGKSLEELEKTTSAPQWSWNQSKDIDLVELAKKCEGAHLSSVQHSDLATALINTGYKNLAKAVLGGTQWAEDIAKGKRLADLEVDAGAGHWSWNDVAANFDATAESVKSVQSKRTLNNGEYIVIPKGMAEKAWEEFSDIAGFYDKDTHSGVFMKNATSDVVIWKTGNWFSWTKRETIKDYVKNHKEVTWSGSPTSFAAESEPSLAPIKTTFTSQQSSWYEPSWYKLYCNPLFSSPVSEKESDMSPSEIQTVIDAVTKNLSKSGVVARKPNMASRALGYTWNTTKLATGWVFAPVKKIAQLTICLTALAGIGYGGYRVWNAIPKALPTIQWEQPEVSPSDVRDDGYTLHNVN